MVGKTMYRDKGSKRIYMKYKDLIKSQGVLRDYWF